MTGLDPWRPIAMFQFEVRRYFDRRQNRFRRRLYQWAYWHWDYYSAQPVKELD